MSTNFDGKPDDLLTDAERNRKHTAAVQAMHARTDQLTRDRLRAEEEERLWPQEVDLSLLKIAVEVVKLGERLDALEAMVGTVRG